MEVRKQYKSVWKKDYSVLSVSLHSLIQLWLKKEWSWKLHVPRRNHWRNYMLLRTSSVQASLHFSGVWPPTLPAFPGLAVLGSARAATRLRQLLGHFYLLWFGGWSSCAMADTSAVCFQQMKETSSQSSTQTRAAELASEFYTKPLVRVLQSLDFRCLSKFVCVKNLECTAVINLESQFCHIYTQNL